MEAGRVRGGGNRVELLAVVVDELHSTAFDSFRVLLGGRCSFYLFCNFQYLFSAGI